jgi:hypothetical protein
MALPSYARNAKTPQEHHEVFLDLLGSGQGRGIPASMMAAMRSHSQLVKNTLSGSEHADLHQKISSQVDDLVRDDEIGDEEAKRVKNMYAPTSSGMKEGKDMDLKEKMSEKQMAKREKTVKSMKKNFAGFKKRYGERAKEVMYATATKQAMKSEEAESVAEDQHYCAKHVYSEVFGEGLVVEGQHAEPDEKGNIEWYTVQFEHGEEVIFTEDVEIMIAEYHANHSPAKKKKKAMKAA